MEKGRIKNRIKKKLTRTTLLLLALKMKRPETTPTRHSSSCSGPSRRCRFRSECKVHRNEFWMYAHSAHAFDEGAQSEILWIMRRSQDWFDRIVKGVNGVRLRQHILPWVKRFFRERSSQWINLHWFSLVYRFHSWLLLTRIPPRHQPHDVRDRIIASTVSLPHWNELNCVCVLWKRDEVFFFIFHCSLGRRR